MLPLSPPAAPSGPTVEADPLDREIRELMSPGVLVISEHAPAAQAIRACDEHAVEAILVVADDGTPVGWAATHALAQLEHDARCSSAATEPAVGIEPTADGRAAAYALALPGTSRLIVRHRGRPLPEGVIDATSLTAVED